MKPEFDFFAEEPNEAWRRFQAGDFAGAKELLLRLERQGRMGDDEMETLIELLLNDAELDQAIAVLERAIERIGVDSERLGLLTRRFDLLAGYGVDAEKRRDAALELLEALAGFGDAANWRTIFNPDRRDSIEGSFVSPFDRLDALEQLAYAPAETGLSQQAMATIEETGRINANDVDISRAAERLLHAFGDPEAAYRVESARKAIRHRQPAPDRTSSPEPAPAAQRLTVVLAGGHPALRATIERDLLRWGAAEVRAIPSLKEASRSARSVRATVGGTDVVVLLVRQLAHSTESQVRRAAAMTGVPVVVADSAGISGVRRALTRLAGT